ncbi:hypothetical protein BH23ACT5_BH23ACT5_09830 [soil metagenome]
MDWYTVLMGNTLIGQTHPLPPRGPWPGMDEADAAIDRYRRRAGSRAGTALAGTSARLAGPYASRAAARQADISDEAQSVVRVL